MQNSRKMQGYVESVFVLGTYASEQHLELSFIHPCIAHSAVSSHYEAKLHISGRNAALTPNVSSPSLRRSVHNKYSQRQYRPAAASVFLPLPRLTALLCRSATSPYRSRPLWAAGLLILENEKENINAYGKRLVKSWRNELVNTGFL